MENLRAKIQIKVVNYNGWMIGKYRPYFSNFENLKIDLKRIVLITN